MFWVAERVANSLPMRLHGDWYDLLREMAGRALMMCPVQLEEYGREEWKVESSEKLLGNVPSLDTEKSKGKGKGKGRGTGRAVKVTSHTKPPSLLLTLGVVRDRLGVHARPPDAGVPPYALSYIPLYSDVITFFVLRFVHVLLPPSSRLQFFFLIAANLLNFSLRCEDGRERRSDALRHCGFPFKFLLEFAT